MGLIDKYEGFDWDEGNLRKNWDSHHVSKEEIEQVFSEDTWYSYDAIGYPGSEKRKIIMSKTVAGRLLFVVYTERGNRVRPISARDMHKTERKQYDEYIKANS